MTVYDEDDDIVNRGYDSRYVQNKTRRKNTVVTKKHKRHKRSGSGLVMVTVLLVALTGLLFLGSRFNLFSNPLSASEKPANDNITSDSAVSSSTTVATSNNTDMSESETSESVAEISPTPFPDVEPPIISGFSDKIVFVGDTVSYRQNIEVEDNSEVSPSLEIDSSQVNLNMPGTYPVKYIAKDAAGNTSEESITITVLERTESEYSLDELLAEADQILTQIIEPGMTDSEKAEAIYWWTKYNIAYVNHSVKSDWLQGAWQGINKRSGDCFNYFATSKLLLLQAGIESIDIVKSTGSHYWSLVNIGDGYYHFDTTPRKAGGEFFMLTDEEIIAYSDKHGNTHVWDKNKYPPTPTTGVAYAITQ